MRSRSSRTRLRWSRRRSGSACRLSALLRQPQPGEAAATGRTREHGAGERLSIACQDDRRWRSAGVLLVPCGADPPARSAERHAKLARQRAGKRLELSDDPRGERPASGPGRAPPPSRRGVARRNACATYAPCPLAAQAAGRSHRSQAPLQPLARSSPAARREREACTAPPGGAVRAPHPRKARSGRGSAWPRATDSAQSAKTLPQIHPLIYDRGVRCHLAPIVLESGNDAGQVAGGGP